MGGKARRLKKKGGKKDLRHGKHKLTVVLLPVANKGIHRRRREKKKKKEDPFICSPNIKQTPLHNPAQLENVRRTTCLENKKKKRKACPPLQNSTNPPLRLGSSRLGRRSRFLLFGLRCGSILGFLVLGRCRFWLIAI